VKEEVDQRHSTRSSQPGDRAGRAQQHSDPMELTFYDGAHFPAEYRGDIFAAFHGS